MRRSVLILIFAMAVSIAPFSTIVLAQTPNPDSGSSPLVSGGGKIHRRVLRQLTGPPPRVESMKLIAPGFGWALTIGRRLFWTTDDGVNWKNITPVSTLGYRANLCDIFFLDRRHAWVLFAEYGEPEPKFDLAYTGDTGATWSTTHVAIPENEGNLAPGGRIAFADSQHGWMVLDLATSSAFHAGTLLLTSDGGRTWRDAPVDPSGDGAILLVAPEEGWMAGGAEDEELYATQDGAKSWRKVSLPAPKEIRPAIYPTADLPVFADEKHGFVAVTYSGGDKSAAVLFSTGDGGRSWTPDRILANLAESSEGERLPSTVADSAWIIFSGSSDEPTLTKPGAGARVDARDLKGYLTNAVLSFVSSTEGWIVVGNGELLSTTDGGVTWTSITPGARPHAVKPRDGSQTN
jgi:photosystem II stability/assembly factor-like uncharacterized protein